MLNKNAEIIKIDFLNARSYNIYPIRDTLNMMTHIDWK